MCVCGVCQSIPVSVCFCSFVLEYASCFFVCQFAHNLRDSLDFIEVMLLPVLRSSPTVCAIWLCLMCVLGLCVDNFFYEFY